MSQEVLRPGSRVPDSGDWEVDALILGGGVAGLAAATRLAARGLRVTLAERRRDLGGRAFSHADPAGAELDNGQHVFLGCCRRLRGWLGEIGSADLAPLQRRAEIPFLLPGGAAGWIREGRWGRTGTALSLLAYPHLSLPERSSVLRCLGKIARSDGAERARWEGISFASLLSEWGQTPRAVRRFWEPVVVSAANAPPAAVAADLAALVFRETLAGDPGGARLAVPRAGLSDLLARPAARFLAARGAQVRFGSRVARILIEDNRASGAVLADGGTLRARSVVSALPWDDLLAALPPEAAREPHFARAAGLSPSPILGVHLRFDREVCGLAFAGLLESPLHWVFNQTRLRGLPEGEGQRLSLIVSAAGEWMPLSREEAFRRILGELGRFFPATAGARVLSAQLVRERRATFAPAPHVRAHRPPPGATPLRGLYLAGAWTDTGWPATLEGAVRSAEACVEAVLGIDQASHQPSAVSGLPG